MQYSQQELNALNTRVSSAAALLDGLKRARSALEGCVQPAMPAANDGYGSLSAGLLGASRAARGGMASAYSAGKAKVAKAAVEVDEAIAHASFMLKEAERECTNYSNAMKAEQEAEAAKRDKES